MYKKYIFIFLLFALHRLAAQTWTFAPEPLIRDTFTTTLHINYGDSAFLLLYDIPKKDTIILIRENVYIHDIHIQDTFSNLREGVYLMYFIHNGKSNGKKLIYMKRDSTNLHFKIKLIINPESIPAETFIAYPNPVENGELNLLYSQDWANGMVTISNSIGQILFTKSLTEIQNNQLKVNELPTGNYILTIKTATKHHSQIITKK